MGAPDLGCKTLSEIYLDRKLETKMTLVIHSIPGFQATSDLRLACPLYLNEINSRQCEMHPKPKGTEDQEVLQLSRQPTASARCTQSRKALKTRAAR